MGTGWGVGAWTGTDLHVVEHYSIFLPKEKQRLKKNKTKNKKQKTKKKQKKQKIKKKSACGGKKIRTK